MTATPLDRRGRPAIAEVARSAGVSVQTVSRVMNGVGRVAPATRAKVQATMDFLGYRPDPAAQALGARRRDAARLVETEAPSDGAAAAAVVRTVAALEEAGLSVVLLPADSTAAAVQRCVDLARDRPGAVIVIT